MVLFSLIVGFLPVLLFLGALILMDSYKLLSRRAVLQAIGVGCLAAGAALHRESPGARPDCGSTP